jgi:preprotein translocase subunit YajC
MVDIMHFFVSSAFAQDASSSAGGSSMYMNFIPLVLIFVVFYFLIIRPQQKKVDQHSSMLKALRKGDRIVTGGGIVGIISKLEGDDYLIVDIADNVRVKVLRSSVGTLLAKTDPLPATESDETEKN